MNKYTLCFDNKELEQKYQEHRFSFTIPAFKTISSLCILMCVIRTIISAVIEDYSNLAIFSGLGGIALFLHFYLLYCKKQWINIYMITINHILMFYQYTVNVSYDIQESYLFGELMMTLHLVVMILSDFKQACLQMFMNLLIKSLIAELSHGIISIQTYLYTYIIAIIALMVLYRTNKQFRKSFLFTVNDQAIERIAPRLINDPYAIFTYDQFHMQFVVKMSNLNEHTYFNKFSSNQLNLKNILRSYKINGSTLENFIFSRVNNKQTSPIKELINKVYEITNCKYASDKLIIRYSEVFITEQLFLFVLDCKEVQLRQFKDSLKKLKISSSNLSNGIQKFLTKQLMLLHKSEIQKNLLLQSKAKIMYLLSKFPKKKIISVQKYELIPKILQKIKLFESAYNINIKLHCELKQLQFITLSDIFEELIIHLLYCLSKIKYSTNDLYVELDEDIYKISIYVEQIALLYVDLTKSNIFRRMLKLLGPYDRVHVEGDQLVIRVYADISKVQGLVPFSY